MRFLFLFFFSFSLLHADWAEDRLQQMSLREKIGQLFMMPACPLRENRHQKDLLHLLEKYHIGNVIVKSSDQKTQIAFLNDLQSQSKDPLFVGIDAEWGLGMRMSDGFSFPRNLTLGAVKEESLLYLMGKEIGRQCLAVGAHINFAPVVDVNSNPQNPIIHTRSFGDDPENVARKALLLMKGMQEEGVLTCAKHFPGHGDTHLDSHHSLPVIDRTREQLEAVDWVPFKYLIDHGVDCVMSAHLHVPALDTCPSTLSEKILKEILRKEWGFQGLIISDALNMQALLKIEEVAVQAFKAGCDILLYGDHIAPNVDKILQIDIPRACEELFLAFDNGSLDKKELDLRVLKILQYKQRFHLHEKRYCKDVAFLLDDAREIKKELYRNALSVIGDVRPSAEPGKYLPLSESAHGLQRYITLGKEGPLIVGVSPSTPFPPNYGLSNEQIDLLDSLPASATIVVFGTPYSLPLFAKFSTVIIAYEDDEYAQQAAAEILSGTRDAVGKVAIQLE